MHQIVSKIILNGKKAVLSSTKKKRDRSQGGEMSLNQIYITLPS